MVSGGAQHERARMCFAWSPPFQPGTPPPTEPAWVHRTAAWHLPCRTHLHPSATRPAARAVPLCTRTTAVGRGTCRSLRGDSVCAFDSWVTARLSLNESRQNERVRDGDRPNTKSQEREANRGQEPRVPERVQQRVPKNSEAFQRIPERSRERERKEKKEREREKRERERGEERGVLPLALSFSE